MIGGVWISTIQPEGMELRRRDIRHAVRNRMVAYPLEEGESARLLCLGPSRAGNLLEVIILEFDDGRSLVIHAMPMRPKYKDLLQ